jgi:tetratricopeptide (TPR) repeat protein
MRQLVRRLGEPVMRWTLGIAETFEATVAGDLADAESRNNANLDLGLEIGEEDAFALFAGQFYQYRSFAWRLEEVFPIVEQAVSTGPDLVFKLAFGILCARFGRVPEARDILHDGARVGFTNVASDWMWSSSMLAYAILANELKDEAVARQLIELLAPHASLIAFNGASSQGCIAANIGRLASVAGDYATAEEYLQQSLEVHTAFGWHYFRATGLAALAENRHRATGELDAFARQCIAEAEAIARPRGLQAAIEQIGWAIAGR